MNLKAATPGANRWFDARIPGFGCLVRDCVPGGAASQRSTLNAQRSTSPARAQPCRRSCGARSERRAFTLVELLVGASLGVLLTGFMMGMVIQVVKEQRRELVDATLQYKADDLEEKLARLIRSMSANETIILGDPLSSGSPFYRRIIVAMGQTPTYARQQLIYDPTAMTLTQDPDITMSSNEILLFKSTPMAKLRNMYFFTSVKSDGVADSSALNIYLQFDDDGFAGRKNPNGTLKRSQVTRYFTVKMRNN